MVTKLRDSRKMQIGRAILAGQDVKDVCARFACHPETASAYAAEAGRQIARDDTGITQRPKRPGRGARTGLDNGRVRRHMREALKTMTPEEVARHFVAPIEIVLGLVEKQGEPSPATPALH